MAYSGRNIFHYDQPSKKLLSLSDKDFFAAIGWLACEHHIYCDEQDGEWYVSNKQPLGFFSF